MKWLLDEMLPPATCRHLAALGHDAVCSTEIGMNGAEDERVFDRAVADRRILVTENFADFALLLDLRLARAAPRVPIVFVHKESLTRRASLATVLARRLHAWAGRNPDPYIGPHWA
jgi:predicted nuclease of predicted toxin-antitoxin system